MQAVAYEAKQAALKVDAADRESPDYGVSERRSGLFKKPTYAFALAFVLPLPST